MNKLTRYAHIVESHGATYLFNVANGRVIAIDSSLSSIIENHKESIDGLKSIHPDLYEVLKSLEMVVDSTVDEGAVMIDRFIAADNDPSTFGIIINPTLDCNLRCWYCYENHGKGTMMSDEVLESVKRLIDLKVAEPEMKSLNMSFFGGEPVIGWDKVVIPLLTYASEACSRCGVKLSCGFTTNGVLLSPSRFDSLIALGLGNTRFQITLDGSKDIHDTSRIGPARIPTYDKIMANVVEGASKGFDISLRFNYTPDTLDSFVDVLDDLESLPKETKANIKCGFHQVWQTAVHSADIKPKADKIVQLFRSEGFKAESDVTYYRYVCYGDRERHAIVNYNGDIFKCTAREFNPSMREGRLTRSGEIEFNNIYHERMAVKYSNPVCRECDILPICYSGCSQNKLEVARNDCYRDRDRHSKQEYIVKALETQLGF